MIWWISSCKQQKRGLISYSKVLCVQVRRQMAMDDYQLTHPSVWHQVPVRLVGSYRHLGSWIQTGGKLCKELSGRFGVAHATFTQYRGAIFANPALSLKKKGQLFESLIMSAVLFNSPAWMMKRVCDLEKYHTGVLKLYRRLALAHFGAQQRQWRDEVVAAHLDLLLPCDLAHAQRLRYLQTSCQKWWSYGLGHFTTTVAMVGHDGPQPHMAMCECAASAS